MAQITMDQKKTIEETRRLHRLARSVLNRLIDDRQRCEDQLAELGRTDAIKSITGRSSIDEVVARTQELVDSMDRLLREADERVQCQPMTSSVTQKPASQRNDSVSISTHVRRANRKSSQYGLAGVVALSAPVPVPRTQP